MSSEGGDEEEEEEEDDGGWGWGSFGGGGAFAAASQGRFSWTTGAGGGGTTAASVLESSKTTNSTTNGFPSRSDLDRNFLDDSSGSSEHGESEYYDAASDSQPYDDDEDDQLYEEEEDALYPGLYRAIYAFEPEGTAEMRLVEDQIVRVVGRGGGVGWAVVVCEQTLDSISGARSGTGGSADASGSTGGGAAEGTGGGSGPSTRASTGAGFAAPKHALVPESYLEPVKLDWELEGEGKPVIGEA